MNFLIDFFKDLGKKGKWDEVSVNGKRVGKLSEDVKVGLKNNHLWIKFNFDHNGTPVEIEGQVDAKGNEVVVLNGSTQLNGRIGGRPIVKPDGLKVRLKFALSLIFDADNVRQEYRFDVKVASS